MKKVDLSVVNCLVFKGGGMKGLCYLGALQAMQETLPLSQVEHFVGTSAGAITAMLLSFRLEVDAIEKEIASIDYSRWLDHEWGILRDMHNLRTNLGWCRSEVPAEWIRDQVKKALGDEEATFRDLYLRHNTTLVVVAHNLNRDVPVYFGQEMWTLDIPIAEAVLASMSIPVVWEPVYIRDEQYIDGGVSDNYPIGRYDLPHWQNDTVLGFWVDDASKVKWLERGELPKAAANESDLIRYLVRVGGAVTSAETVEAATTGRDRWRTVYIDTDLATLDFDLNEDERAKALEDGRRGWESFVARNVKEEEKKDELED